MTIREKQKNSHFVKKGQSVKGLIISTFTLILVILRKMKGKVVDMDHCILYELTEIHTQKSMV